MSIKFMPQDDMIDRVKSISEVNKYSQCVRLSVYEVVNRFYKHGDNIYCRSARSEAKLSEESKENLLAKSVIRTATALSMLYSTNAK